MKRTSLANLLESLFLFSITCTGFGLLVPSQRVILHVPSRRRARTQAVNGDKGSYVNGDKGSYIKGDKETYENVDKGSYDVNGDKQLLNGFAEGGVVSGYSTESGYSQFLTPRATMREQRRLQREQEERDLREDGYVETMNRQKSILRRAAGLPLTIWGKVVPERPKEPGTLILVRHGESTWNHNKTFTGWADPDLTEQGVREVEHAARLLLAGGYQIDSVFTSRLKRAIRSAWILLREMDEVYIPVFKSWRLNERMYGGLTSLSKKDLAEQIGHDIVQAWRGSLEARPPAVDPTHPYWPGRDRRYSDLSESQIPLTESLHDCMERTAPIWETKIMQELKRGRTVMVVAHANTLRGLVKTIDGIGDEEIQEVAIPTGIPIIYKFDKEMKPIPPSGARQTEGQKYMNGLFLEKPGLLKEALARETDWASQVPGYDSTMAQQRSQMAPLERSLFKLKAERELGKWAGQFIDPLKAFEDDGSDGNTDTPIHVIEDEVWDLAIKELGVNGRKKDEVNSGEDGPTERVTPSIISNQPCVALMPSATVIPGMGSVPVRMESVIVIIRHGQTEHNKLGLFTGWEDAPLALEGLEEAKAAGQLLKAHGFEFDVVYTSWLSRAIETAWHVLDELDSLWLPIVKSWRLNERMYGELTGLSKRMVAQRHGDEQFKAWRRGYKNRPPPVSSFSPHYPGNDIRYQKYLSDVRYSVRESVIRSIESGKITAQKKLPKSESLKDCMDRTIPYFTQHIIPEAVDQGKRILISSSENAIRGLLMHLCEIPEEHITDLEIPHGLPIIFDVKSKCVKLLDDGTGQDPMEVYNFGKAASYLFRPCVNEDGSPDEDCDISYMRDSFEASQITAEDKKALEAITRNRTSVPV